jgi:opacity protein-like surface antigen
MSPNTCLNRCRLSGLLIVSLLVVACFGLVAEAKDLTGTHEVSLSVYGATVKTKYEDDRSYYYHDTQTDKYINTYIRYGYFFYKGFEIEPEFLWYASNHGKPGFAVTGNLVYNFNFAKDSACCPIMPFLLADYSISTGMQYGHMGVSGTYDDNVKWKTHGYGIGAGVKAFVSPRVALRLEYRYESHTRKNEASYYSSGKTTSNSNNVMAGFSIFFPPCKKGCCGSGCAK